MKAEITSPEALTLDTILTNFSTDEKARVFLETWLWPNGPTCARCGTNDQSRIAKTAENKKGGTRAGLYRCNDCRRTFTVTVGTIFEDSHLPLRKWLVAWFLIASSKKGISALQIQRILDIGSYRTAHFLTHRIRHALKPAAFTEKLTGTVEVDETWVGGKERREFKNGVMKTGFSNKTVVMSLVERGGTKRSMIIPRVTGANARAAIDEHVAKEAMIMTDQSAIYNEVGKTREHHAVDHGKRQYAFKKGALSVHSNTVESSFSLLKRGIIGAFHSVSKKYLPLYLAEFDHRWNMRKETDGERCVDGIQKARGKRLTYRAIKGK